MKKSEIVMRPFLKRKVSLSLLFAVTIILLLIIYVQSKIIPPNQKVVFSNPEEKTGAHSPSYNAIELTNYKFVHPLLLAETTGQSEKLSDFKNFFNSYFIRKKSEGVINSASALFMDLNDGEWTSVNGGESYNLGSLVKIPLLISSLKQYETNPSFFEKAIFFDKIDSQIPVQTFGDEQIQLGKIYTVNDLLFYMAAKSDNYSTHLLNAMMDAKVFKSVFTDLKLPAPDLHAKDYKLSVEEYTKFMRVLYASTYLNAKNSEYALTLLSQGAFKEGFLKQLPANAIVSHKFGEFSMPEEKQLHESGIFYVNNHPYLLTVMTRGNDVRKLPEVLSDISKYIYDSITIGNKNI